jgi:hypothetical protein
VDMGRRDHLVMGVFTQNLVVEIISNSKKTYRVRETFEFHSGEPDSGPLIRCKEGFQSGVVIIRVRGIEIEVKVTREVINSIMEEAMIAKKVKRWKRVVINTDLKAFSVPLWRNYWRNIDVQATDTTK